MVLFKEHRMKKVLKRALEDGELTDEEVEEILQQKEELGVSDEVINKVRTDHFEKVSRPLIKAIGKARRFTPDDEERLIELGRKLRVQPNFAPEFTIYRKLWEIEETGQFTPEPIDVDIRLAKNELCYHYCPAIWKQVKVIKKHTGYVGGSVGFRVAKGVTLRMGRAVPTYQEYEDTVEISAGDLYVTNKKLVFVGGKRSTNVTYGRLVQYEIFGDGIEVIKTSGKPDLFQLNVGDVEYIDALLQVID